MNIMSGVELGRAITVSSAQIRAYWFRGLVKTMIQSGATAGSTFLATAGANAAGIDVAPMSLRALVVVFVAQAAVAGFNYLKDHPLPDQDDIPQADEQAMAEANKQGKTP